MAIIINGSLVHGMLFTLNIYTIQMKKIELVMF